MKHTYRRDILRATYTHTPIVGIFTTAASSGWREPPHLPGGEAKNPLLDSLQGWMVYYRGNMAPFLGRKEKLSTLEEETLRAHDLRVWVTRAQQGQAPQPSAQEIEDAAIARAMQRGTQRPRRNLGSRIPRK